MKKVKLEDELISLKRQKQQEADSNTSLKEVKLLLAGEEQEDLRILKAMGRDSTLVTLEKENGKLIELENLEKEYAGGVFVKEDIKNLCIKYHLRFLPSVKFTGDIAVQVASEIKKFARQTNTNIDDHTLRTRFYIMAPPECFRLVEKKFMKTPKAPPDPLLFYHIGEDKYRLIHKWGNDFSIFRRFLGFRWESLENYWVTNFFLILPIAVLLITMLVPAVTMINYWGWFVLLILTVATFFTSWFNSPVTDKDWFDGEEGFFGPYNWDSPIKLT